MAILPLQIKLVYGIGKAYGYELDRGHIKDFAATLGVGLTGQFVEQIGRKLIGGLFRQVGGGLLGGLGRTADGATPTMLEAGSIPGCAIGLDPGANERHFAEAAKLGRNVPVFCSELYPGWLTHWGEPWAKTKTEEVLEDLGWLLENRKSFNLYVVHGGINFGFWAGANMGETYQPDVKSCDYDAPLNERYEPPSRNRWRRSARITASSSTGRSSSAATAVNYPSGNFTITPTFMSTENTGGRSTG